MPNRILKESITTSEDIDMLSAGAEILFYRLIVKADDFGAYYGNAKLIRSNCFPLRVDDIPVPYIETWLDELVRAGLVERYIGPDGRDYIHIHKWNDHQRIRNSKHKFPPPSEDCRELPQIAADCRELPQIAALIQFNPIQSETESESLSVSKSESNSAPVGNAQPEKREITEDERQARIDHYVKMLKSWKKRGWDLGSIASLAANEGITTEELNAAYAEAAKK